MPIPTRSGDRERRSSASRLYVLMSLPSEDLARIKRVVADYPDAPTGIENFLWLSVPSYWDHLRVPLEGRRATLIHPRREDQHGGLRFRVGWDEHECIAALWLL